MKLRNAGYELLTPDPEAMMDQINDQVAVVMVTEVDYRSGRKHDMSALITKAHSVGAIVVWDMAHSLGAIPVNVTSTDADFAIGCTYKYINGGPGAPAFIYVAPRLIDDAEPVLSGWFGHEAPFAFDIDFRPMPGKIERMRIGTPSLSAFSLLDAALDVWDHVDIFELQEKSVELSNAFIAKVEARCPGVTLASPRDPYARGSHVSFVFEHSYSCMQALIDQGVIGDFRAPNIMRFGITPLFINMDDIERATQIFEQILSDKTWQKPQFQNRSRVT